MDSRRLPCLNETRIHADSLDEARIHADPFFNETRIHADSCFNERGFTATQIHRISPICSRQSQCVRSALIRVPFEIAHPRRSAFRVQKRIRVNPRFVKKPDAKRGFTHITLFERNHADSLDETRITRGSFLTKRGFHADSCFNKRGFTQRRFTGFRRSAPISTRDNRMRQISTHPRLRLRSRIRVDPRSVFKKESA